MSAGRQYFERNGLIWGSSLAPTQRFTLLALNDHADQHGESCYPGQQTLAALTGYNRRTISRALENLREKGVVNWTTNGRITATKATNDYHIDFDALESLQRRSTSKSRGCDRGSQPLEAEDHNPLRQRITRSTHRSTHEICLDPPLTPHGGNGAIASQNSEPSGNQQAKPSGKAQKGKGSAAARSTKNQTSEQILSLLPKDMQARFEKFWKGYSAFCGDRESRAGAKKPAVVAWKVLVESNFNGKGIQGFDDGVRTFLKQQGDRTSGIPHAARFLYSAANDSGAWEDAIEQANSKGSISDLSGGVSDRGNSPPIFEAPVEEPGTYGPPPEWVREKYNLPKRPADAIAALAGKCSA